MPKASPEKEKEWRFSNIPQANVFHPTLEEFANPLKYITSIREVAKTTGIINFKVVLLDIIRYQILKVKCKFNYLLPTYIIFKIPNVN